LTADRGTRRDGRTALLLGATGLVGGHLLDLLLEDPRYSRVTVIARRRIRRRHPKLAAKVVDFERLAESPGLFGVDDVFCALGTTMAQAGSRDAFRRVDHDYVVDAARLAAEAGAEQFLLVSSLGADSGSRVFYNRTKGEAEVAVKNLPFRALWILRPSLLRGSREEVRWGEAMADVASRLFGFLLRGRLRRYRPVAAADVAAAMTALAAEDGTGGVVESEQIPVVAAGTAG
jgi:uncharacterized protein YbjT (DUF2867 family)